jgi:Fe-S-cluster containining protein
MSKPKGYAWVDAIVPHMACDKGCTDCCGVVAVSQGEYEALLAHAFKKNIKPVRQGTTCPWFQDGGCSVYEARPFVCRFFGHTDLMTCPHGYNENVDPHTERLMEARYARESATSPNGEHEHRLLHEVVMDAEEILGLLAAELSDEKLTTLSLEGKPLDNSRPEHRHLGRELQGLYGFAHVAQERGAELPKPLLDFVGSWRARTAEQRRKR